jgi:hypothetical protein
MVNSSPFQGEDYGFDPRPGYQFPQKNTLQAFFKNPRAPMARSEFSGIEEHRPASNTFGVRCKRASSFFAIPAKGEDVACRDVAKSMK